MTLVTGEMVTWAGAAPLGRHCLSPGGTNRRDGAAEEPMEGALMELLADCAAFEGGKSDFECELTVLCPGECREGIVSSEACTV